MSAFDEALGLNVENVESKQSVSDDEQEMLAHSSDSLSCNGSVRISLMSGSSHQSVQNRTTKHKNNESDMLCMLTPYESDEEKEP